MSDPHKRLHTLFTDRAIAGLDRGELEEFEHLRAGAALDPSYEIAAAAIELSLMAHATPLPAAVVSSVLEQAGRYWGFTEARPHDPTRGARQREPSLDTELLLGDDGDLLLTGDEATPVSRMWEASPRFGVDEAGVLESSLTDGRVSDSLHADIPRDLVARGRPGSQPHRRKIDTGSLPKVAPSEPVEEHAPAEPTSKPRKNKTRKTKTLGSPDESHSGLDAGPSLSASLPASSEVVRMPVSESKLARALTYISAIAALLMLAVALWLYAHRSDPPNPETFEQQLAAAEDKLEWSFVAKTDPAVGEAATGSITWSSNLQRGVVTLEGILPNDPAQMQYQLWIVDKQREGPPVNGGVFDIEADGQTKLTVEAKLVIGEPGAFLITAERPGGVVVSTQERLLMVAAGASN